MSERIFNVSRSTKTGKTVEELEEINGVTFRKFCLVLSGGNKPYSKSYTPAELKALVESEA